MGISLSRLLSSSITITHCDNYHQQHHNEIPHRETTPNNQINDLSYEELKKDWVRALDLGESIFEEDDEGWTNTEFLPSGDKYGSSDEDVEDVKS